MLSRNAFMTFCTSCSSAPSHPTPQPAHSWVGALMCVSPGGTGSLGVCGWLVQRETPTYLSPASWDKPQSRPSWVSTAWFLPPMSFHSLAQPVPRPSSLLGSWCPMTEQGPSLPTLPICHVPSKGLHTRPSWRVGPSSEVHG